MESVHADAELASELVPLLGRELRSARNEIKILSQENKALRQEAEVLRSQVKNEQPESITLSKIESVSSNSIPFDYVDLQNQLEKYKEKYRKCREAKHATQEQCKTLEVEIQTLSEENGKSKAGESEILKRYQSLEFEMQKLSEENRKSKAVESEILKRNKFLEVEMQNLSEEKKKLEDENSKISKEVLLLNTSTYGSGVKKEEPDVAILEFVTGFPAVEDKSRRWCSSNNTPICRRGVDLKVYLAADNGSLASSSKFLYLSGAIRWYSSNGGYFHSAAFCPTMYYDQGRNRFIEKAPFQSYYGKVIELFYPLKGHIHYAGTYKCHDLRIMNAPGVVPNDISLYAITDSVFSEREDTGASHYKTIKDLYEQGILKVDAIGLQYVGFNDDLFKALDRRFNNPPDIKRKAGYAEHPSPITIKKPRMGIEKVDN